jgi:tRNA threonylcarbamoyladenosine biosynthesis protein TsaE
MHEFQRDSVDLAQLEKIAELLVRSLPAPQAIGLSGTLGSGKTKFVQLLAKFASQGIVEPTSPTFTLLQSYVGTPKIHHLDAYRLIDEDEFVALGVDELFDDAQAWTIVEWAEKVEREMPGNTIWIELSITSDSHRSIRFRCRDSGLFKRLETTIA